MLPEYPTIEGFVSRRAKVKFNNFSKHSCTLSNSKRGTVRKMFVSKNSRNNFYVALFQSLGCQRFWKIQNKKPLLTRELPSDQPAVKIKFLILSASRPSFIFLENHLFSFKNGLIIIKNRCNISSTWMQFFCRICWELVIENVHEKYQLNCRKLLRAIHEIHELFQFLGIILVEEHFPTFRPLWINANYFEKFLNKISKEFTAILLKSKYIILWFLYPVRKIFLQVRTYRINAYHFY